MKSILAIFAAVAISSTANAGVVEKYLCTQPKDDIYGAEARASFELSEAKEVLSIHFWEQNPDTGVLTKSWFDESSGTYAANEHGFLVKFQVGENFDHYVSIFVEKDGKSVLHFAKDGVFSAIPYDLICAKE